MRETPRHMDNEINRTVFKETGTTQPFYFTKLILKVTYPFICDNEVHIKMKPDDKL